MEWFKKKAAEAKSTFTAPVHADTPPSSAAQEAPDTPSGGRSDLQDLSKEELIAMLLQKQQAAPAPTPASEAAPRVVREQDEPVYMYDSSVAKPRRPASPILRRPCDREEDDYWPPQEDPNWIPSAEGEEPLFIDPHSRIPLGYSLEEFTALPRDRDHIPSEPLHTTNQINLQVEAIKHSEGVVGITWTQPGVTFAEEEKHPNLLARFADALMHNEALETLGMDWMKITDEMVGVLFPPGLKLSTVRYFNISSNEITNAGVTKFVQCCEAGGFAGVEVIGLTNNQIIGVEEGVYDLANLVRSGRLTKLRWLHLRNEITDYSKELLEKVCDERNVR